MKTRFYITLVWIAILTLGLALPHTLCAQDFSGGLEQVESEDETPPKEEYKIKDHIRFGGNLGAQFGTITFINVSPMVGYQFNKRYMMGVRGTYMYYKDQRYVQFSNNILGASAFGRFFAFENIFAHAEYEVLNGYFDRSGERVNLPFLYLGIGYLQEVSNNVGISISALYEILRIKTSPTVLPSIRVGVVVGL
ncbi:MAG: hypothetical protein RLP15_13065 [Cryomorphaceae bacterium]